jgi:hypothetical protein
MFWKVDEARKFFIGYAQLPSPSLNASKLINIFFTLFLIK